ncbi:MAG: LamG-like jellyroll fold domain-containing protein, partial [Verrucomicrobiota bacterium]
MKSATSGRAPAVAAELSCPGHGQPHHCTASRGASNPLRASRARRWLGRLLPLLSPWLAAEATAMTWSGDAGPWGPGPMNACVQTWNDYASYGYNIPVVYSSGTPTADAGYLGQIRFGGSGNYRTAMHESSHWMGTGTTGEWDLHQRWGTWNGTYTTNLRRAYDGPGERQFIYGAHYGPQGANYDSEGVQGPQMVGIIGAFRRDQNLQFGDQTIGIAPDRYRLRNRVSVKTLDNLGSTTEGAQVSQNETLSGVGQEWDVNLIIGTRHFTLRNVSNDKYLDSLGSATDGSPVAMTSLAGGTPTDSQLWEIVPTDSFFFKIINKANGKALDNLGASANGSGVAQWTAANNFSWNQHWTFAHPLAQFAPPAGVISQGCWAASSSTDANHYDTKGNNGVSGDRWTASSGSFPQWWQVDLGSVQPMTKVATAWFPGAVFQYRVEVSDNGSNFTVAADRTNNTSSGTTVDSVSTSGRFVRVVITGTTTPNWAAIMECRVYNEAQPMQQLSQFRPVTASSEQPGNLAVNATDVDPIFTRWCSASSGYPAWWQVDLGTSQQVNKAVIQWFDDDGRSYQYRVEGSNDGTNFTTLIDRTGNTTPSVTTDSFSGVARWVRVTVTGGSSTYPSIYEAQIYGALTPQTPSAPQSVAATAAGSQINLSWATSFGATSYSVKRATSSGGPYTTIASPTSTSFSDTTVSAGIPYYYVVMASNSAGESPDSTESIAVVGAELHAYLPFDEANGVVAADLGGFARNGTLINGPLWSAGNAGNAVDLDGTNDHVALPAGVVSALNDFTVAAWINPDVINNWARIFDIGTGTNAYMFLCPSSGSGTLRFSITNSGGGGEQQLNGPALSAGVWTHVAVTLSGNTGTLYVNGVAVSTNNAMTLRPSSLGNTTNNWIGRSQYPDPYFNGRVDDLRIYNRALNLSEVGTLRGALTAAAPSSLIAQTDDNEVSLNWSLSLGATSYQLKRTTTSGGPYTTISTLNAGGHTDTTTVNGMTYYYVVSAVNAAGQSANSAEVTATTIPLAPVITSGGSANGTAGVAFSYQITASNSPTSYGATGLPAGLNVNMSSGLIDGTPTAA